MRWTFATDITSPGDLGKSFLIYIYVGTPLSIPQYPGEGLCLSSTLGKDLQGSNAHPYLSHHVKDSGV